MEEQKKISCRVFPWLMILFVMFVNLCFGAEDPTKFPTNPITYIVPWPPGGSGDLSSRKLADFASKVLGQPILVVNKPGGGGVIGTYAISKADADGYTIGHVSQSCAVITPHVRSVPFDTQKNFTFIMQYCEYLYTFCVLVDSPWKTFKEFIEDARKNPGKLTYCTPGPLGGPHIFMEQVILAENVQLKHLPVQGDAEMVAKHLGGHVDGSFGVPLLPHIPTGKVRALAVLTGKRVETMPDVPTFSELGYKIDFTTFVGIIGPAGIDPRIVKKLHDAFKKAYDDPSFKEFSGPWGLIPIHRDSESFKAMVIKEFDRMGIALKKLGLKGY